jgi:hypothetical protein
MTRRNTLLILAALIIYGCIVGPLDYQGMVATEELNRICLEAAKNGYQPQ